MPTVELNQQTYSKLHLVAAALEMSDAEAVAELLRRLGGNGARAEGTTPVLVHIVYKGERVEGTYDPRTKAVTITSGVLTGNTYTSPSRAAMEVVKSIDPNVDPHRNGWGFWLITSTGKTLQSIRSN